MKKTKLTIIDDEQDMLDLIQQTADSLGFSTDTATSGRAFLKQLHDNDPDVIVLDLFMPEMDGLEVLQALAEKNSRADIILMTGYETNYLTAADTLGSAHGLSILGTIAKPFPLAAMEALLSKAQAAYT